MHFRQAILKSKFFIIKIPLHHCIPSLHHCQRRHLLIKLFDYDCITLYHHPRHGSGSTGQQYSPMSQLNRDFLRIRNIYDFKGCIHPREIKILLAHFHRTPQQLLQLRQCALTLSFQVNALCRCCRHYTKLINHLSKAEQISKLTVHLQLLQIYFHLQK